MVGRFGLFILKGAVVGGCLMALLVAERLYPAAHPLPTEGSEPSLDYHRWGRNLGLWLFNLGLSPLFVAPVTIFVTAHTLPWRDQIFAGDLGVFGLLLDLLLLDLFLYLWHRANHRVPLLWRFHQVHHRDRFLDVTSSLRFHFGEVILSAVVRGGFIVVADISLTSVVIFESFVLIAAAFHHSNLRLPSRFETVLQKIIVTPSIHWVHHHRLQQDTDSNYATILSFWDHVFLSRSSKKREISMPIGIESEPELPFVELLLLPLTNKRESTSRPR